MDMKEMDHTMEVETNGTQKSQALHWISGCILSARQRGYWKQQKNHREQTTLVT